MLPRNFAVILLVAIVSFFCHLKNRQTRPALFVGDALNMIEAYYVDPVDAETLLQSALTGMTSTLDEHSSFIPGEAFQTFQDSINQEFAGIGIIVEPSEQGKPVRVVTPLVGSPALAAGLMPGDLIVRVDGSDVSTLEITEVSTRLKGPVGTTVHLVVLRREKEVAIDITRATIALESVIGDHRDASNNWVYRIQSDPGIAYIRLTSFGDKTVDELRSVLTKLDNQFEGLVLDLRGNGGGLLYSAVEICDMFLDEGKIVSTRMRGGEVSESFSAEAGTLVQSDKPMTVIVDGDSASASEIVAACLQDNKRAAVVGVRSYGKGTVQEIMPLQYGHSALRLTIARYYRPSDKNIHRLEGATDDDEWGVRPDEGYEVSIDDASLEKLVMRWRKASYPLLTEAAEGTDSLVTPESSETGPTESGPVDTDIAVESDSKPQMDSDGQELADGLLVDPQLRRAVEYLRKRTESEQKPTIQAA